MYVVMDNYGSLGVAERYTGRDGEFWSSFPSGWEEYEPHSWWLVPALDLPPLPEEEL
jgi:hypothetical protein